MGNLAEVLKGARKEPAKSKSKVPILMVGAKIRDLATKTMEAKDEFDSAQAKLEMLSADLIENVTPRREEYINKDGFVSSVKVPTNDDKTLTVVYSSNYTKCSPDNEETIRNIVGERYQDYFETRNVITVKAELTEEQLEILVERVGVSDFADFFEVSQSIRPTERFKTEQFFRFSREERERLMNEAGIKAYKPSIKR